MLKKNPDGTFGVKLNQEYSNYSLEHDNSKIKKIVSRDEELTWNEKRYIRHMDKGFFTSACGLQFMGGKEIDHDWRNGCICRVVSLSEHVKLGVARGEHKSRGIRRRLKGLYNYAMV